MDIKASRYNDLRVYKCKLEARRAPGHCQRSPTMSSLDGSMGVMLIGTFVALT